MASKNYPAPGTFFRAVGQGRGYCLEVVQIIELEDGRSHWTMRRWGMKEDRQPFDDGHISQEGFYDLTPLGNGVLKHEWRSNQPRWSCCPMYFREIKVKGQQQSLF